MSVRSWNERARASRYKHRQLAVFATTIVIALAMMLALSWLLD
jgi:hypothetical protein